MITPDASSRVIASGPGPEIDALVEALAAGRPAAGTEALDPSFVQSIGEIVAAAPAAAPHDPPPNAAAAPAPAVPA